MVLGGLVLAISLAGCTRGRPSSKPPIHPNPNMMSQEKYKAQSGSAYFTDSAAMRVPVEGTVARGELQEDPIYYRGRDTAGAFVGHVPLPVGMALLQRGRERFDIYCAPCHSRVGDGRGIMVTRGYLPPPSFHDDRIRGMRDGEIFNTITNGIRNMPSYGAQIPVADRWAIIAYLRALQRSHNAAVDDVPAELRGKAGRGAP
jgi:hypothetical protein